MSASVNKRIAIQYVFRQYTLYCVFPISYNHEFVFFKFQRRDRGLHAATLYGKVDDIERHLFVEVGVTRRSLVVRPFLPTILFLTTVLEFLNLVHHARWCWELPLSQKFATKVKTCTIQDIIHTLHMH